jgi:hypothetical protein
MYLSTMADETTVCIGRKACEIGDRSSEEIEREEAEGGREIGKARQVVRSIEREEDDQAGEGSRTR